MSLENATGVILAQINMASDCENVIKNCPRDERSHFKTDQRRKVNLPGLLMIDEQQSLKADEGGTAFNVSLSNKPTQDGHPVDTLEESTNQTFDRQSEPCKSSSETTEINGNKFRTSSPLLLKIGKVGQPQHKALSGI